MRSALLSAVIFLAATGCTAAATNVPMGGACVRSAQCMPGLACVPTAADAGGICTNDVSGLTDGAQLPPLDMGNAEMMAVDMGVPVDMGTPVDMPAPVDMGTPMVDMGTPMVDMGTPMVDMGGPTDAGTAGD